MSRIGRLPIPIPDTVSVDAQSEQITIKGPAGQLQQSALAKITWTVDQDNQTIVIGRDDDSRWARAGHGLMRSLIANMVVGVTDGFQKRLEINGIGYRGNIEGSDLVLSVGFSHPVRYRIPDDVKIEIDRSLITVSGIDKQRVGQTAAEIRSIKKPEPYKGKGIKYVDEVIARKAGKGGKEG